MSTEYVTSEDGTPIAYRRGGKGPPLVLIHGTAADHARWNPALPALEEHFTVYAVDRRGRGGSGDALAYSLEREFGDVAAVVNSISGRVDLLGHSYGAICALESVRRSKRLRRLVLYEPPVPVGIPIFPPAAIDCIEALLEEGDRQEAISVFLREVVKVPPHELNLLRAGPAWQARVATAYTLPRETRAVEGYDFDPARFRELEAPTLLLVGSQSPPFLKAATEAVDEALPNSRIVVMPGQAHAAMDTGTDLFTTEVVRFLTTE